jgi:hypothetical protein
VRVHEVPSKVRVLSIVYQVKIDHNAIRDHGWDNDTRGLCDVHAGIIHLDERTPLTIQRTILWHEVKHAIYSAVGRDAAHKPKMNEEESIDAVSVAEVAVLRDNPLLVSFLLSGGEWDTGDAGDAGDTGDAGDAGDAERVVSQPGSVDHAEGTGR